METLTWIMVAGFVLVCMQLYGILRHTQWYRGDLSHLVKKRD